MSDYNNISDNEIRSLLKKRLLEHADDDLLEAEAKMVFATAPVIVPPAAKEKLLIKKSIRSILKKLMAKWMLPGVFGTVVLSGLVYYVFQKSNSIRTPEQDNSTTYAPPVNKTIVDNDKLPVLLIDGDTVESTFIKHLPASRYQGQIIEKILKENADCANPIIVKDTIVFSPYSPKGNGNELEIFGNPEDDLLYFENEHNTVWYKFFAWETGQLTFDIIPVDPNDDYDFMLYKWSGGDFRAKVMNKKIKPVRACISRNDKKLESRTGLLLDESLPPFVHSGEGTSYVKYFNVRKGETYYLLVDNVYNNGNGHTIHFHYKPVKPGELYIGHSFIMANVTFKDSDTEFKPGTGYERSLDSLYNFLIDNPGVKIEIQGHVNTAGKGDGPTQLPGKPSYTDLQLSQERARVIYKFLVKKGIDPERLNAQGYAGLRKRIQEPLTIKECYMNIRIEVLIISLDYKKEPAYIKKHKKDKMASK
jgi:outer membrane protein OmpA-like peptidoglycan-associated protein